MEAFHYTEMQLKQASSPRLHSLRLCGINHVGLRLGCRSTQISSLGEVTRCERQQRHKREGPTDLCPPAEERRPATGVAPEAIVFLMFASISSLEPSPAVSSTTSPFLST